MLHKLAYEDFIIIKQNIKFDHRGAVTCVFT